MGFSIVFSNCHSNYPFCYTQLHDENRCVLAVKNLGHLYLNFFNRYCNTPYSAQCFHSSCPEPMTELCYNLWDRFPMFPTTDLRRPILDAGISLLESLLLMRNDHIIVSGVEALCSWAYPCNKLGITRVHTTLAEWKKAPTTVSNKATEDCHRMIKSWLG